MPSGLHHPVGGINGSLFSGLWSPYDCHKPLPPKCGDRSYEVVGSPFDLYFIHRIDLAVLLLLSAPGSIARLDAQTLRSYRAAVHIHSTFSTGSHSIAELTQMAEQDGLDILVVTDHARISMAWRMSPYRNLLRVQFDQRSVFQVGVERYLSAISAANRAHPRVLILPGIEATANHYFTGCCGRTSPRCNRAGCMSSGDFRSIGYGWTSSITLREIGI